MEDNNVSEDYINEGGSGMRGLSYPRSSSRGKKWYSSGVNQFKQFSRNTQSETPLSEWTNASGYGESTYDEGIDRLSQLEDLEDTRSELQPFVDKLGAGLGTFAGKTITNTVGSLGLMTYGVYNAFATGKLSGLYDNNLSKALDSINESIDENTKVYMSNEERNGNFFQQTIGSSHFWTKSILGDAGSFIAGAMLGGAGAGLAMKALSSSVKGIGALNAISKAGDILSKTAAFSDAAADEAWMLGKGIQSGFSVGEKALSKTANFLKGAAGVLDETKTAQQVLNARSWDKFATGLYKQADNMGKFLASSAYEGGVEANDLIKQSRNNYIKDYYEKNNRMPSEKEMADFNNNILPAANALFLANTALVGWSHYATGLGIFGKGVDESIKNARKLMAVEKGVADLAESSMGGFEKAARFAGRGLKPIVSEGIVEEGGQNFMKNLSLDYIDKHYNPDASKNVYDVMNSLGNAFNNAYATSDGWKEILSGMIVGGLGGPNLGKIGRMQENEDGTKSFKPFSLDSEKSWWSGGVFGAYQDHHKATQQAQQLIDDYNSADVDQAMEYFMQNRYKSQGITSQLEDINHQNASSIEYDKAVENGDFYTAKNAEADKFHHYVKSRIDAGYFDVLKEELIKPIESMSIEDFAEAFGYENADKQDLETRKSEAIKNAKQSIKDVSQAISEADNMATFNLSTEEGRQQRNMLIYSLSTIKNVGKRIQQMNDVLADTFADGIDVESIKKTNEQKESVYLKKIDRLENSKENKSEEAKAKIDEEISKLQTELDKLKSVNLESVAAANSLKSRIRGIQTVRDIELFKEAAEESINRDSKDPDIQAQVEKLDAIFKDLPKLLRRKEEAIELYSTAKDKESFNNFWMSDRVQRQIRQNIDESIKKMADILNEEVLNAEEEIDNGGDPEVAAAKTGASKTSINKLEISKAKLKNARAQKSLNEILDAVNKGRDEKFGTVEDLEDFLESELQDPEISPEQFDQIEALLEHMISIRENASSKRNEPIDVKPDVIPVSSDIVNEVHDENIDLGNDILNEDAQNPLSGKDSDSKDKLINAYDHIAWSNVKYNEKDNKNLGINPEASEILQDFTRIKPGTKVRFKIVPSKEYKIDNVEMVPIQILINDEVVGYVHDVTYIRKERVVDIDDNINKNKEKLIELRKRILAKPSTELEITFVGNGRLMTSQQLESKPNENIPTNEALPDPKLKITVANDGRLELPEGITRENLYIMNEKKIVEGTKNQFRNAIYTLIPIGYTTDGKIKYIAAPLSPTKLGSNPNQVELMTTMITGFLNSMLDNRTLSQSQQQMLDEFKLMAEQIKALKYEDDSTGEKVSFDPLTVNGLRNLLGMFTHVIQSKRDDLGYGDPGDVNKMIFGINQVNAEAVVLSFGTPGKIKSYKIHKGNFYFKDVNDTEYVEMSSMNYAGEPSMTSDRLIEIIGEELTSHLNQSLFYHDKKTSKRKGKITIPQITTVDGKKSIKLVGMTYAEHLKNNTQTNLRSHKLKNDNYSYTVQRNVVFSMPKLEESSKPVVKVAEQKPSIFKSTLAESEKDAMIDVEQVEKRGVAKPQVANTAIESPYEIDGEYIEVGELDASALDLDSPMFGLESNKNNFKIDVKSNNLKMDFVTFTRTMVEYNTAKSAILAMKRDNDFQLRCK